MYAVIAADGKQYRVAKGDVIQLESVKVGVGESVNFDKVLLLANGEEVTIGTPYLETVKVSGEVIDHKRGEKIRIIKFKRRKGHMKRAGYRARFADVKIIDISTQVTKTAKTAKAAEPVQPVETKKEIKATQVDIGARVVKKRKQVETASGNQADQATQSSEIES